MTVARDIMKTDLISVTPETEVIQAARLLLEHHINGVPVLDGDGNLVGILCQSDLVVQQKKVPVPSLFTFLDGFIATSSLRQMEKELRKIAAITVAEAMTPEPVTVGPETRIETVAELMVDNNFHTLPVVEDGRLIGIIGKEDILRTLLPGPRKQEQETEAK
ncbi:MAG: CBS domain-containing protein [Desulfobacteraceae bacterium]|nr:CBS domain-containing protein [Desulfobacteraceae bacterium]